MATTTSTTGWPDATNSGVPAGVTLTPSGSLVITQAGTVISGLNITGTVYIEAANVTLENCTITGATTGGVVYIQQGVTGTVVENCTINGTGSNNSGSTGIFGSGTFIGNNIYNVENGIAVSQGSTSTVIEDNYIHNLLASGSPHYDGIQIDGAVSNVTISHNTVINSYSQTSAIMIDNGFGAVSNISVDNNLLSGGGYTLYDDASQGSAAITGVSFTNNHLSSGQWGYTDFNKSSPTYTGNVNDGAALVATLNTAANHTTTTAAVTAAPAAPVISSWSPDTGVVGDGITDANHLTINGTAVANSTVKVYDGSTQVGTATADSSGIWSLTTSTLSDAKHVLTATDTVSGSTSAASGSISVTVDTSAPAAPVETGDTIVNSNHVSLVGTAEANSTVTVYDGTTVVGTGTANSSGSWTVTTSALPDGAHNLTSTATDAAGNVSVMSAPFDPVIDTTTTTTTTSKSSTTTTTSSTAWPDATNTGVPAGVTLTASGSLVITKAGTVISGLNITGTVYIEASNVTLENCTITGASTGGVVQIQAGMTGVVVANCTINGTGANNANSTGIFGSGTFTGNNIYNVENGIAVMQGSTSTVIENNYIHNLLASGSPHYDGIQIDGAVSNVTISHNTVINSYTQTSAIMIDNYFGAVSNISVDNNLLSGGGLTVYDDATQGTAAITGVSFTNNHIGSGYWGDTYFKGATPTYTGNVDDGAALVAKLNTSANGSTTSTAPAAPAAPVISSWSPDTGSTGDGVTDANKLTLKGTAAANATVKVYDGSTLLGSVTASSTGAWTYTTSALADAKHSLTATETVGGVTSAASSVTTVTVDTVAPSTPVLTTDSIVNTNHVLLSGTAEANSTITVYDGTTVVGTGVTNSSGSWSVTTSALSKGAHDLTATATDVAGNVSVMSPALDPVVGASPAAPVIVSFSKDSGNASDHITNDNTLTLTGTAVANSTVKVFDGATQVGSATANGSGQWSVTTSVLKDGSHSLTATDTDSSGLTSSASNVLTVGIDTSDPYAPTMAVYSQAGAAIGAATSLSDVILKGTSEGNSTVTVYDGSTQIGTVKADANGAWSLDTGHLATGSHSFTATATDIAGNTGVASAADLLSVTTTGVVDFTSISENANHVAAIKGSADPNSLIKLYEGSIQIGTATADSTGAWHFSTAALSDTVHTFTAQEVTRAGATVATSSGAAIVGSSGHNVLTSTSGNDAFFGNGHPDTFVFASNFGHDVITDFVATGTGHDTIQFSASEFSSFASVLSHASQVGQDVLISAGNDTLTLKNTKMSALTSSDFHFA